MPRTEPGQVLVDWVMHNDIEIDAPPGAVWPAIVDTNPWHGTSNTSVAGPKGGIGERFDVSMPQAPQTVVMCIENVELAPEKRRTIRVESPDGDFFGYSSWILQPRGGRTVVTYDIFCFYPFPEATASGVVEQGKAMSQHGLELLKGFVEKTGQFAEA